MADTKKGSDKKVAARKKARTVAKKQRPVQKPLDIDKYNEVVASAELGDISLVNANFSLDTEYFAKRSEAEEGEGSIEFLKNLKIQELTYEEKEGFVGASFNWSLEVKSKRKQLLKLDCEYICYYTNVPGMDREVVEVFMKRVGRFATYPYFRSLASQMSWASGTDLPLLPVLKERIKSSSQAKAPVTSEG